MKAQLSLACSHCGALHAGAALEVGDTDAQAFRDAWSCLQRLLPSAARLVCERCSHEKSLDGVTALVETVRFQEPA